METLASPDDAQVSTWIHRPTRLHPSGTFILSCTETIGTEFDSDWIVETLVLSLDLGLSKDHVNDAFVQQLSSALLATGMELGGVCLAQLRFRIATVDGTSVVRRRLQASPSSVIVVGLDIACPSSTGDSSMKTGVCESANSGGGKMLFQQFESNTQSVAERVMLAVAISHPEVTTVNLKVRPIWRQSGWGESWNPSLLRRLLCRSTK